MAKARASAEDLAAFLHRAESKAFQVAPLGESVSALERLMAFVIQGEHGSFAAAERSVKALRQTFVHWNEVRVARRFEVRDALSDAHSGDADNRATLAQEFLRRVFGLQNHLELDWLYDASAERRGKLLAAVGMAPDHAAAALDLDALDPAAPEGDKVPITPAVRRLLGRMNLLPVNPKDAAVRELVDPAMEGKRRYPAYLTLCALAGLLPVSKQPRCKRTEALNAAFKGRSSLGGESFAALLAEAGYGHPLAHPQARARAAVSGASRKAAKAAKTDG
jgi:hypothetical protein